MAGMHQYITFQMTVILVETMLVVAQSVAARGTFAGALLMREGALDAVGSFFYQRLSATFAAVKICGLMSLSHGPKPLSKFLPPQL